MMRLSLIVVFLCLAAVFMAGCGKDKFVGNWTAVDLTRRGIPVEIPAGRSIELVIVKEKGEYLVHTAEGTMTTTPEPWTLEGNSLTKKGSHAPGFDYTGKLTPNTNGDELTLTMDERGMQTVVVFKRKTE